MKLDLGSGPKPEPGHVSVDCRGAPDIWADLEDADGLIRAVRKHSLEPVDAVRASHVFEHIHALMPLLDAIWCLLEPGGRLEITVPHKDSETAWNDPTHVRFFLPATFFYFTDHRHFKYLRHYWEMAQIPTNLDAYNRPAPESDPWCNMRCVLRKEDLHE